MTDNACVAWPIAVLSRYLYASPEYLGSAVPLTHLSVRGVGLAVTSFDLTSSTLN